MIFERWATRFKYRNRSFWCRGFCWLERIEKKPLRVYTESTKEDHSETMGIRIGSIRLQENVNSARRLEASLRDQAAPEIEKPPA